MLKRILRSCGTYYHSADLFYQELWSARLASIGFRVLSVEKLPYHPVWEVRLCGNLTAQAYLLLSRAVSAKAAASENPFSKQLESEIKLIAKELGLPLKRDCLSVTRNGKNYFRVSFVWPKGKAGRYVKQEKKQDAFSLLILAWLRKTRN